MKNKVKEETKKPLQLKLLKEVYAKNTFSMIKCEDRNKNEILVKGYNLPSAIGVYIMITDYDYIDSDKDGKRSIYIKSFHLCEISFIDVFVSYLSKIPGIDNKTMSDIFWEIPDRETLHDYLENRPGDIKKISKKLNVDILRSIENYINDADDEIEVIHYLSNFTTESLKRNVIESVKKNFSEVKKNPFSLLRYKAFSINSIISGCNKTDFEVSSSEIDSYIVAHCINELKNQTGSCTFSKSDVCKKFEKYKKSYTDNMFNHELFKAFKVKGEIFISLSSDYTKEMIIAENIVRKAKKNHSVDKMLIEKIRGNLDDTQIEAVKNSLKNGFSVITGGPGTGKTTTLKTIVAYLKKKNKSFSLLAPTGKAAKRMSQVTSLDTYTIHSYFKIGKDDEVMSEKLVNDDYIIIDESSMLTTNILHNILINVSENSSIILLGDVNQLEAIGTGSVLEDIINSKAVPVTNLVNVYRQNDDNLIAINAARIKNATKENPIKNLEFNKSFCKMNVSYDNILAAYKRAVKLYGEDEVCILSPFRNKKYEFSTEAINAFIKKAVNPDDGSSLFGYNVGDRVMQLENDAERKITNGSIGKVIMLDKSVKGNEIVKVIFDDEENNVIVYDKTSIKQITLAYAISVHKSQGSEYKSVLFVCTDRHAFMLNKKVIYTAITRAKDMICTFTENSTLEKFSVIEDTKRKTFLKVLLKRQA